MWLAGLFLPFFHLGVGSGVEFWPAVAACVTAGVVKNLIAAKRIRKSVGVAELTGNFED